MRLIEINDINDLNMLTTSETTLVLGYFDGVHLGHQLLIATGKKIALETNTRLAVLTFNQHPSIVFTKQCEKKYLTTLQQKVSEFEKLGVDDMYVISFTSKFASVSAEQFVSDYIIGIHAKVVVVGFDYHFGREAKGDAALLKQLSKNQFEVVCVPKVDIADDKISSTRIREHLLNGEIEKANQLLGRAYETVGTVMHGDARGRTIGFPTANISQQDHLLPAESIYVVEVKIGDTWHKGMASIGRNITFESNRPVTVEVNIFDFNEDIYGEKVAVRWLKRLRKEIKFNHVDGLISQLNRDKHDALNYFSSLEKLEN